jgi:UMF1 family MFS transporter
MGATQALSRSIYSQLIPAGKESEYFSVYELSEKGTSWLGPVIFAIIYNITFSYRFAILSLIVFFIIGFILLLRFDFNKELLHKS